MRTLPKCNIGDSARVLYHILLPVSAQSDLICGFSMMFYQFSKKYENEYFWTTELRFYQSRENL